MYHVLSQVTAYSAQQSSDPYIALHLQFLQRTTSRTNTSRALVEVIMRNPLTSSHSEQFLITARRSALQGQSPNQGPLNKRAHKLRTPRVSRCLRLTPPGTLSPRQSAHLSTCEIYTVNVSETAKVQFSSYGILSFNLCFCKQPGPNSPGNLRCGSKVSVSLLSRSWVQTPRNRGRVSELPTRA